MRELPSNGNVLTQHGLVIPDAKTSKEAFYFACKRIIDVLVASVLLVLLSPVMLAIFIAIKLDTPGKAIFVQDRVGAKRRFKEGQYNWEIENFRFYKFRSMYQNAGDELHKQYIKHFVNGSAKPNEDGKFKLSRDPRITRVGAFLRKTSLDELPQLINVIKGDMSLVGPRPVPTYEVAEYKPWHMERLQAIPGITGLWQAMARCQVSFEDMIRMDIEYVRTKSLWLDLKLLLITVPSVLFTKGAD
jgi:lipopolysaccharide/colanic/teichoic acid biosynthesis glycosyltransferase